MTIRINNHLLTILAFLILMGLTKCIYKEREFVFKKPNPNDIEMKLDSIKFPPEISLFPIRITLTNYSNTDAILTFKKVLKGNKYQKGNLFLVSGRDTILLGINDDFLIVDKYSEVSFNVIGFYSSNKVKKRYFFNDFHNFPKGKIVYQVSFDKLNDINKKDLKQDTLLVPSYLETSTDKAKTVLEFSRNSMERQIRSLKK